MNNPILFRTIGNKERLVDRVVEEIQNMIVQGHLEPGVKLPPERELAEQIGVSRTVIREAVRILMTKGLLDIRPGVGTIVRQVTRHQMLEPLSLLLQAYDVSLDNLHQVRSILEVGIAGLAAVQATEEDIQILRQILVDTAGLQKDTEAFAGKDAEFHYTLAETTHNPLLVVLLLSLQDLMQEVRSRVHRHPDVAPRVLFDHDRILETVIARDPEAARLAMQEHLEHARIFQEEVMKEQGASLTD